MNTYIQSTKELLELADKPFASGGEGEIYAIESPLEWMGSVAKIYHLPKRTIAKQNKIAYLLAHPPAGADGAALVWVQAVLTDEDGAFVGLVMPKAAGEKLEILCTPKLPRSLRTTWYRFHRDAPQALSLRLKLCYNIAIAIQQIHALEQYILVDFKPDNVLVQPDGLVALVDLDSIEIVENGITLFDAPVATPDYTPPEYYRKNTTDPTQQQAWDRFSMAVVCYKVLLGIHPFAASYKGKLSHYNDLTQKIEHGLYVHAPHLKNQLAAVPPLHNDLKQLPKAIQGLFDRCFVAGHLDAAQRPTVQEWCSTLLQCLDDQHLRHLPSTVVSVLEEDEIMALQQLPQSPKEMAKQQEKAIVLSTQVVENVAHLQQQRQIGWLVFLLSTAGLSAVCCFTTWWLLLLLVLVWGTVLANSYSQRENTLLVAMDMDLMLQEEVFLEKQQTTYSAVKIYLDDFYQQLCLSTNALFRKSELAVLQQLKLDIQASKKELIETLKIEDEAALELMKSETKAYQQLNEKYLKELHQNPIFATAVGVEAELAAIGFAEKEALAQAQKKLHRKVKKEKIALEQEQEKQQRLLDKIQKDYQLKKLLLVKDNAHALQAALEMAKSSPMQDPIKKGALTQENLQKNLANSIDQTTDLLKRAGVDNLNQIEAIHKTALVLASGKQVPLSPLRYYHIHELVTWWKNIKQRIVVVSEQQEKAIETTFKTQLEAAQITLFKQLNIAKSTLRQERLLLGTQHKKLTEALRQANEAELENIKSKYRSQKNILQALSQQKAREEKVIYAQYSVRYQELLEQSKAKGERVNQLIIKGLLQHNEQPVAAIEQLKQNKKTYEKGIVRLQEEYQRLYQKQLLVEEHRQVRKYKVALSFWKHLAQLCYLKKY